jgi:hypothetical protein
MSHYVASPCLRRTSPSPLAFASAPRNWFLCRPSICVSCVTVQTVCTLQAFHPTWQVITERRPSLSAFFLPGVRSAKSRRRRPCHDFGGYLPVPDRRVALVQFSSQHFGVFTVTIIPSVFQTHSFIYHTRCIMFLFQYFSFPVSIIPPLLHTHLYLHAALTRRINGRGPGSLRAMLFRKSRSSGQTSAFDSVFSALQWVQSAWSKQTNLWVDV